jgi:PEP-CTERM motif
LNGANPLAFLERGGFNVDEFFRMSDGSLFSNDFNLVSLFAGDTFATNIRGFDIGGISANGAVGLTQSSAVPEPSTWAMLLIGFAGLGFAGSRRLQNSRGRYLRSLSSRYPFAANPLTTVDAPLVRHRNLLSRQLLRCGDNSLFWESLPSYQEPGIFS